jgi:hypothetical protein
VYVARRSATTYLDLVDYCPPFSTGKKLKSISRLLPHEEALTGTQVFNWSARIVKDENVYIFFNRPSLL